MKNIYTFIIAILLGLCSNAQYFPPHKGTLTDPTRPIPGPLNRNFETNNFDWTNPSLNINKLYYPSSIISNPYFNTWPNHNGNVAKGTLSDFWSRNGWELVKRDFGFLHNGNNITVNLAFPYFVLYNKYNGILRVWAALNNQNTTITNKVNVTVSFVNSGDPDAYSGNNFQYSALLSPVGGLVQTLDQPTKITESSSSAIMSTTNSEFLYADFQMAYDPCACLFEQALRIKFEQIMQFDLKAKGRLLASNTEISNFDFTKNADFLSSVLSDNSYNAISLTQTYNTLEKLRTDWDNSGNNANIDYKQIFKDGVNFLVDGIKFGMNYTNDSEVKDVRDKIDVPSVALDFFSSLMFDDVSNSTTPPQPTVVQGDLAFTGRITGGVTNTDQPIITIPGSLYSESRPEIRDLISTPTHPEPDYPMYNEILGQFAVLKKPTAKYQLKMDEKDFRTFQNFDGIADGSIINYIKDETFTYAIPEKILYTWNDIIKLLQNKTRIEAALQIEFESYQYIENEYFGAKNMMHLLHEVNSNTRRTKDIFLTPYVNIECLSDLVTQISYRPKGSNLRVNELVDLNHHPDLGDNPHWEFNFHWEIINGQYYYYLNEKKAAFGKVFLKIKFLPEYENDYTGEPNQKSIQLYTYETDSSINILNENASSSLSYNKSMFNVNPALTISTMNYSNDEIIYAEGKITITGNLTTSNNAKVRIISAYEIEVQSDAMISPEISLEIGKFPIDCNLPLSPILQDNLHSYCNNTSNLYPNYNANSMSKKAWFHNQPIDIKKQNRETFGITFNPFPNPSKNNCAIDFTLKKDATVSILISDVSGKEIYKALDASAYKQGHFSVPVNMDLLDDGIYFCTFTTADGYNETKKIVVLK
ncbi:MAG: T9SS type A sorting domain-containing protein [Bacteroidota bacterium]